MTDSPRFQPLKQSFEDTYQRYHGANLVACVLSCADRWAAWREHRTLAGSNAQAGQTQLGRDAGPVIPVGGADGEPGGQTFSSHTQTKDQTAARRMAMLFSPLPVVLAMAAALPNDAKAWGEVDVPASKQSRLGGHLLAIDSYNLLRGHARHLLFVDVRTAAEMERLGMPHFVDANVPFLDDAVPTARGEQPTDDGLVAKANFVRSVGEQLAAKALAVESVIILICADGTRSARAADVLAEAGYSHVYTVIDGFEGDQVAGDTYSGRRATNGWKLSRLPWFYPSGNLTSGATQAGR